MSLVLLAPPRFVFSFALSPYFHASSCWFPAPISTFDIVSGFCIRGVVFGLLMSQVRRCTQRARGGQGPLAGLCQRHQRLHAEEAVRAAAGAFEVAVCEARA